MCKNFISTYVENFQKKYIKNFLIDDISSTLFGGLKCEIGKLHMIYFHQNVICASKKRTNVLHLELYHRINRYLISH